ncbi:hypothetical protein ACOSQ3_018623 [Xanthoceras sorbifolium]
MDSLGKAVMVLIPKSKLLVRILEFKPINLCNVVYKVIAKVLANRLKVVLDKVISPNESAFEPGRLITGNVLVGFEYLYVLRSRKLGKMSYIALKLDMNKTYYRVE